ncbi:hypothetical protein [Leucobacter soli]|uniref:hypothetical protein n=1 Tax=Leucobacter soli TaxID=2812850 RepID=UPI00360F925C
MNESPDDEVSADEAGADEAGTVEANTDEVRRLRAQNPSLDANAPEALRRRVEGIPSQESATGRRAWLAVAAAAVVVGMVGTAFAFGSRGGLGGAGATRSSH